MPGRAEHRDDEHRDVTLNEVTSARGVCTAVATDGTSFQWPEQFHLPELVAGARARVSWNSSGSSGSSGSPPLLDYAVTELLRDECSIVWSAGGLLLRSTRPTDFPTRTGVERISIHLL